MSSEIPGTPDTKNPFPHFHNEPDPEELNSEKAEKQGYIKPQHRSSGNLGPEEIENRFGFHKATIEGTNATLPIHTDLRLNFREIAEYLDQVVPNGRAKATMFTELENASMWAHKAVAEGAPLIEE